MNFARGVTLLAAGGRGRGGGGGVNSTDRY